MTNPAIPTFDLNQHMARLLLDEPFFASLSRRIDKRIKTDIPTAGVWVNEHTGNFELLYNPEFFASLDTDTERLAILKHEFYHIIFLHVTGRLPEGGMSKKWNYATDLAINGLPDMVNALPKGCLIPGEKGSMFESFPVGLSADQYYAMLPDKGEGEGEDGQQGDGDKQGSHDGWGENDSKLSDAVKEIAKERLKNSIREAAKDATKKGWGSVGSDMRQEIMDRLSTSVDWRKTLRYFIKTSTRANKVSSIKRINRRYPRVHAGRKVKRTARIAVAIDQSGSVSDSMLAAFFNELDNLAQLAEFTVVPFDTEVDESLVYVWKKGQRRKWERVKCGGTDFNPPTEYVNKNQFDGMIVLTDMEASKPIACKGQRMWMTTKHYADRPYFKPSSTERIIAIDA
jgi:predicted metal-dependent peptidase